jgi:ubiquinol-cytochrome c reductase subunit 6
MADVGDIEDPKPQFDKECLVEHCQAQVDAYELCCERIKTIDSAKEPHCYQWYFDIVHCVDHCSHPRLWPTLK